LITHNIHLQESIICGEKENTDNPCHKKLIWAKAPWTYIISSETIPNKLKKKIKLSRKLVKKKPFRIL